MSDITDYVPVVEVSGSTSFDVIIGMDIFTKGDFSFTSDSENPYFFYENSAFRQTNGPHKMPPPAKEQSDYYKSKAEAFLAEAGITLVSKTSEK